MSTISAAVVVWTRLGISASGSPPAAIAIVPPALLPDSFPHPQSSTAQKIPAYLIAAMSTPRQETAERARAHRCECPTRPTLPPPDLPAISPRQASSPQLQRCPAHGPATNEAKQAETNDDWQSESRTVQAAAIGHHRRGSSRVATKRRPRDTGHCRRVLLRPQSALPSPAFRSKASRSDFPRAGNPQPLPRARRAG